MTLRSLRMAQVGTGCRWSDGTTEDGARLPNLYGRTADLDGKGGMDAATAVTRQAHAPTADRCSARSHQPFFVRRLDTTVEIEAPYNPWHSLEKCVGPFCRCAALEQRNRTLYAKGWDIGAGTADLCSNAETSDICAGSSVAFMCR